MPRRRPLVRPRVGAGAGRRSARARECKAHTSRLAGYRALHVRSVVGYGARHQCGSVGVTVTAGEQPLAGGRLGGGHVLLAGSTGFLGQAVLERLLRDWPDTRVSLLIRGRGSSSAADRLGGL